MSFFIVRGKTLIYEIYHISMRTLFNNEKNLFYLHRKFSVAADQTCTTVRRNFRPTSWIVLGFFSWTTLFRSRYSADSVVDLLACFGSLSCCVLSVLLCLRWQVVTMAFSCKDLFKNTILNSLFAISPNRGERKQTRTMIHLPPCFTVGMKIWFDTTKEITAQVSKTHLQLAKTHWMFYNRQKK